MAQGCEGRRFEGPVDDQLHCLICLCILRDPVQCRTNDHNFCRHCITTYLRNSQKCPRCEDPLTVETLSNVPPSLLNTLSELDTSCEHKQRVFSKVVKLGCLAADEERSEFSPMSYSNDECAKEISQCDECQVCDFQNINCDYCSKSMPCMSSSEHSCPRTEISELKSELAKFRSYVQGEVVTEIQQLTSIVTRIEETLIQSSGKSSLEPRAEIVVAGGEGVKSTIVLNVASGKWRCLAATYECEGASSVLNENHMHIAGGSVGHLTDIVKQLDLSQHNAQWTESQVRLPFLCRGHTTVLCQNDLCVIGGLTDSQDSALSTIHVIPLTPAYKPELVCKLPEPKCYHGATVVNDKVYIVGGCKQYANTATDSAIEYDPAKKECKQLKRLPYAVSGMATASWQNKVLVIGGLNRKGNYLDSVIMYDIVTQRYHILPTMQKKRAYCTAVVVGNKLIVMGGADERSSRISSVECYDFQTYTWSDMAPMDEPRAYATAVVNYY